jgi:predicted metalloprotease with PDZ domain
MTALRAFITIGIAALWLLLVVPPMFMSPPSVYTGLHLKMTGAAVQPNIVTVDRGSPAYRAGFRSGDVLGCLSPHGYAVLMKPAVGFTEERTVRSPSPRA